jgi:hypothetical protein
MKRRMKKSPESAVPRESRYIPALVDVCLRWPFSAFKGVRSLKESSSIKKKKKTGRNVAPRGSPYAPALAVIDLQWLSFAFHGVGSLKESN